MSFTDFLFDTSQANIDREVANYNPIDGTRKKDFGDILGDLLTGQGSVIDQGVKDTYKRNLEKDFGIKISRLKKELPNLANTGNLNITENTDRDILKRTIEDLQVDANRRANVVQQVQALGYGDEIGDKDINALSSLVGDKVREKELKLEKTEQERYGDTRKDKSDAMVLALMNQQAGNRRADNQFNLQMSQQDYNNRVLEQTDRRNSRKDQREMLMTIMLGLDNIGKNFA